MACRSAAEFVRSWSKKLRTGKLKIYVTFIPVWPGKLEPALMAYKLMQEQSGLQMQARQAPAQ